MKHAIKRAILDIIKITIKIIIGEHSNSKVISLINLCDHGFMKIKKSVTAIRTSVAILRAFLVIKKFIRFSMSAQLFELRELMNVQIH